MTSTPTGAPPHGAPPTYRRAFRDLSTPVLGGVAAGLAAHLAVPVLWVRVFFVVATATGGLGVALYAALWVMLPAGGGPAEEAPGLAGAARDGRRPAGRRSLTDLGPVVVLAALGIGAVFAGQAVIGSAGVFWPVVLGVVGLALLWRQADQTQRERWFGTDGRVDPVRIVLGAGGLAAWARIVVGTLLLLGALFLLGFGSGTIQSATTALGAGALGFVGLAVVVGPWAWRLAAELSEERAQRVRTEERADMAAHLHDSVLQTLAMIQKNAGDPHAVARLARSQERDLRAWLFDEQRAGSETLAAALRAVAAEVEDAHDVSVDVVTVGDLPYDDALAPLAAAAREAVANAARHAGVPRVDVYAEVDERTVEVFVRDRGAGFDLDAVPADRHGVRHSILDRMTRHGGRAEVRTSPGGGTEVRLRLDRTDSPTTPTPDAPTDS
ncbi:MAG: ATPase [Nocardioides sp.]|nr:ATPase [Nocardioides sp.]